MKVSILTHGFINWGGGIDFIRFISSSIDCATSDENIYKSLIVPMSDYKLQLRQAAYPFKRVLRQIVNGDPPSWQPTFRLPEAYYHNTFSDLASRYEILYSGSTYSDQLKAAKRFGSDIILPCLIPPHKNISIPWIGYIPDLQHRQLPQFFSKQEIKDREQSFQNMLNRADHVIVNARAVKRDIEQFFPGYKAKIYTLPFSPHPQMDWLTDSLDCRRKYKINKPYFMICNQFWKHKDHKTAFKAFARYLQGGGNALLVCTGATNDYRFQGYFEELQKLIKELEIEQYVNILGHIPKNEQVALIKKTLAIVQPTLFEGGPGGGACYDAIALGVPVIASDIPVNLEIEYDQISFFEAGSDISLSQALYQRGSRQFLRPSSEYLMQVGQSRQQNCGEFILDIIEQATGRK